MPVVQPVISTADLPRLRTFYEQVFGAEEVRRFPAEGPAFFVGLRLGDSEIGLVSEEDADLTAPQRILLSVEVEDVDGRLGRVEPAGGKLLGPATDMPWGHRVAHVHDPDGNLVNLAQPI